MKSTEVRFVFVKAIFNFCLFLKLNKQSVIIEYHIKRTLVFIRHGLYQAFRKRMQKSKQELPWSPPPSPSH